METILFIRPGARIMAIQEMDLSKTDCIYKEGNVTVTTSIFKVGEITYPIAGISSFRVVPLAPDDRALNFVFVIAAFFIAVGLVMATGDYLDKDSKQGGWAMFWIGLLIVAGAVVFMSFRPKPAFAISITTFGRDQIAVTSPKLETARLIDMALQRAVSFKR
jgi:uncharacterized membrane protein HdeD (DUF308 family)